MLLLKKALLVLLLFTILGSAGYVGIQRSQLPQQAVQTLQSSYGAANSVVGTVSQITKNPQQLSETTMQGVSNLNKSASDQITTLASRSSESGSVLGDFVQKQQTDDSDKALHEQAVEYGQYLYCKQVVEVWEKENEK